MTSSKGNGLTGYSLTFDTFDLNNEGQKWWFRNQNGYTTIYSYTTNLALDFTVFPFILTLPVSNGDSQLFSTTDGSSLINKQTKTYLGDSANSPTQSSSIVYFKLINV